MGFFDDIASAATSVVNDVAKAVTTTTGKAASAVKKTYKEAQKKTKAALKTIHSEDLYEATNLKKLVTDPKKYFEDNAAAMKRDAAFAGQFWGNFVGGKWGDIGKQAGSDFSQLQKDVGIKVAKDDDIKSFAEQAGKGYESYNKGDYAGAAAEAAKGTPVVKSYSKEIGQATAVGQAAYNAYNGGEVTADSIKAFAKSSGGEFVLNEVAASTGIGKDKLGAAVGLAADAYGAGGVDVGKLKDAAIGEASRRASAYVSKTLGVSPGDVSKLARGDIASTDLAKGIKAKAMSTVNAAVGGARAAVSGTVNAAASGLRSMGTALGSSVPSSASLPATGAPKRIYTSTFFL